MTNTICPKCGSSDVVWDNDERIYGYARYSGLNIDVDVGADVGIGADPPPSPCRMCASGSCASGKAPAFHASATSFDPTGGLQATNSHPKPSPCIFSACS